MELDQREFDFIRELVYEKSGLSFDERKLVFVGARVKRRCEVLGCDSPREYYRHLRYEDREGAELQQLIESLTTNETYFFREYPQLACFANDVLPELTENRQANRQSRLAVWSAACSTGDEAYTLAIILRSCMDDFDDWDVEVVATDIDSRVLATAQRGGYTDRAVRDVPDPYYQQHFEYRLGQHFVTDDLRQLVDFQQVNLMDRRAMRAFRGFDAIFCRNALIYFNDVARRRILASFYDALIPGGYLFLGHSESVGRISAAFEMVSHNGYIAYRRPLTTTSAAGLPSENKYA